MSDRTPAWGIEPVPDRLRTLGPLDNGLLWSSLGLSLLVLVAGAVLAPLGLPKALLAIAVGGVLGNALLAVAALLGAQARVPAMVLLRAPLGRAGSWLPTALNVVQNVGWTIFEVIVIAAAARALVGGPAWLWKVVAAAAATALALVGPVGFVREWVRRFALWVVLASLAYLTWWALDGAQLTALWSKPATGGFPSFWQGVDLMIAMPASWLPLAADYTRFSRDGRGAFWGAGVGYLLPSVWLFALGALLMLSRGLADAPGVVDAIAAGGAGAALALVALVVDETKVPFANVYSTAVSLQNVVPRAPQRALIALVGIVSLLGAFAIDLVQYASFLLLIGSFFVPLFGVLLAQWLLGRRGEAEPRVRAGQVAAWLAGFAVYQWLSPVGPAWWTDAVARTHAGLGALGGSLPSFAAAFVLSWLLTLPAGASRRRDRASRA